MLKKLIKYDMLSTIRYMLPIYLLLLFITGLTRIVTHWDLLDGMLSIVPMLTKIIYQMILVAIIVITYIIQAVRYYTNMVSDEGYLTFTLPVKTSHLTLSKLITSVFWCLCSTLLVLLSISMVYYSAENKNALYAEIKTQFESFGAPTNLNVMIISFMLFIMLIIMFATNNLFLYTSIALGQMISKNKFSGAFLAGIIVYMFMQVMMLVVMIPVMLVFDINVLDDSSNMLSFITVCSLFQVLISILMYMVIHHIFSKRLNLE